MDEPLPFAIDKIQSNFNLNSAVADHWWAVWLVHANQSTTSGAIRWTWALAWIRPERIGRFRCPTTQHSCWWTKDTLAWWAYFSRTHCHLQHSTYSNFRFAQTCRNVVRLPLKAKALWLHIGCWAKASHQVKWSFRVKCQPVYLKPKLMHCNDKHHSTAHWPLSFLAWCKHPNEPTWTQHVSSNFFGLCHSHSYQ